MTALPILSEFYARLAAASPQRRARRTLLVFCWILTLVAWGYSMRFALSGRDGVVAVPLSLAALLLWKDYGNARVEKAVSGILFRKWPVEWLCGLAMTWPLWVFRRLFGLELFGSSFWYWRMADILAVGIFTLIVACFLASLAWWWVQVIAELGWPVKPKTNVTFSTEGVWPPPPRTPGEKMTDEKVTHD